jgi:hypothetical protein
MWAHMRQAILLSRYAASKYGPHWTKFRSQTMGKVFEVCNEKLVYCRPVLLTYPILSGARITGKEGAAGAATMSRQNPLHPGRACGVQVLLSNLLMATRASAMAAPVLGVPTAPSSSSND